MFQVGDKIVHPMHGAGIIDSIVQKKVNGVVRDYYILKLPVGGIWNHFSMRSDCQKGYCHCYYNAIDMPIRDRRRCFLS